MFFQANPVEMYNRTFRGISTSEGLTLVEQARLFAMLNLSGADAAMAAGTKGALGLLATDHRDTRRTTVIRRRSATRTGRRWSRHLRIPDHPSGYNCVTGSFMYAAKAFFGKGELEFTLSPPAGSPSGPYNRFTDVIDDTIDARIYQGIHFRSADEDGAWIGEGRPLARQALPRARARRNDDDDGDDD